MFKWAGSRCDLHEHWRHALQSSTGGRGGCLSRVGGQAQLIGYAAYQAIHSPCTCSTVDRKPSPAKTIERQRHACPLWATLCYRYPLLSSARSPAPSCCFLCCFCPFMYCTCLIGLPAERSQLGVGWQRLGRPTAGNNTAVLQWSLMRHVRRFSTQRDFPDSPNRCSGPISETCSPLLDEAHQPRAGVRPARLRGFRENPACRGALHSGSGAALTHRRPPPTAAHRRPAAACSCRLPHQPPYCPTLTWRLPTSSSIGAPCGRTAWRGPLKGAACWVGRLPPLRNPSLSWESSADRRPCLPCLHVGALRPKNGRAHHAQCLPGARPVRQQSEDAPAGSQAQLGHCRSEAPAATQSAPKIPMMPAAPPRPYPRQPIHPQQQLRAHLWQQGDLLHLPGSGPFGPQRAPRQRHIRDADAHQP